MATHFTQLGPDDTDHLVEQLIRWHHEDGVRLDAVATRREIRRILSDNLTWHGWLIRRGEEVVGYLMLNFRRTGLLEASRAHVAALYVVTDSRHLRIGRQAQRFVADLGRWLQVRVFEFDTEREDKHLHLLARSGTSAPRWMQTSPRQAIA